jgi:tetratricopeptide (TPR) repeat protein
MATGLFDEVERWANESRRLGEVAGQPDSTPLSHSSLSVLRIMQGRLEEAGDLIRPVIEQFPGATLYFSAALAWALAEQGRTDEAKAILDGLRARAFAGIPRDYIWLSVLVMVSRACSRLEDSAAAAELYALLLPYREAMATAQTIWLGPVAHDLGLLATVLERYDEAEEHFAVAVQAQDRMGAQGMFVHTRLACAHMLLRRAETNDAVRARALLQEAKAGARAGNIPAIEARIDELLAQLRT